MTLPKPDLENELNDVDYADRAFRWLSTIKHLEGPNVEERRFLERLYFRWKRGPNQFSLAPMQLRNLKALVLQIWKRVTPNVSPSEVVSPPPTYPYAETGGVSYYQKRGWAINRPKRK